VCEEHFDTELEVEAHRKQASCKNERCCETYRYILVVSAFDRAETSGTGKRLTECRSTADERAVVGVGNYGMPARIIISSSVFAVVSICHCC
jgi:hypothetical protein